MLYSRNGGYPSDLPAVAVVNGVVFSDWSDQAALDACGYVAVANAPSYDANTQVLSWTGSAWELDALPPPSLIDAQSLALQQLQTAKASALASMTYVVNAVSYTVTLGVQDQLDVQTQLAMLTAEGNGVTCRWEIVDNDFLTFAASDLQSLQTAGVQHVVGVYMNADALTSQIKAADSVAGVSAIDLTQGWPA